MAKLLAMGGAGSGRRTKLKAGTLGAERVLQFVKMRSEQGTLEAFARRAGINPAMLNRLLKATSPNPTLRILRQINDAADGSVPYEAWDRPPQVMIAEEARPS